MKKICELCNTKFEDIVNPYEDRLGKDLRVIFLIAVLLEITSTGVKKLIWKMVLKRLFLGLKKILKFYLKYLGNIIIKSREYDKYLI